MSIWDNVKKFAQPFAEDDEYDDEDEFEEEDYDEEEEEPRPAARSFRRAAEPAPKAAPQPSFTAAPAAQAAPASTGFAGSVVSAGRASSLSQQIVLAHPTKYEDATASAKNLRENKAVVLNLENVDKALARRVVDFLSGSTYVLEGSVRKVAQSIYLFVPHNMEVLGDLESLQSELEYV